MSAAELHHRPTPAGLLTDALGPVTFDGLEVITRVVDRLGVDLTAELADLVRMAMTRAVNRALTSRPALVIVDDELAYEARARIGYLSAPAAGEVIAEGHESAAERFGEDTGAGTYEAAD